LYPALRYLLGSRFDCPTDSLCAVIDLLVRPGTEIVNQFYRQVVRGRSHYAGMVGASLIPLPLGLRDLSLSLLKLRHLRLLDLV